MLVNKSAPPKFQSGLDHSSNVFRDKFKSLTDEEWEHVICRSISEPTIDGVEFPRFPEDAMQLRIHGHWGQASIREAMAFYRYVKGKSYITGRRSADDNFLDFGSGWGRITRTYLRDFDLKRIYGFEPNLTFCATARVLNPYVCFMNGGFLPDGTLPENRFDLVVGWSIFSHLSPRSASEWLMELARTTRKGAHVVLTTWGRRFLNRLIVEGEKAKAGDDIDWYSQICIKASADLSSDLKAYDEGEFVWLKSGSDLYGEAFLGEIALQRLLADYQIPFALVEFDCTSLSQDAFVLVRQ